MKFTQIETSSGYPTSIAMQAGNPRVATQFGDDAETLESHQLRDHYDDALRAVDREFAVWCKNESDSADLEDGEEVWYPRPLDVQPTHWLMIDGRRIASVLPVGDGCEPEELTSNSGLSTREEWLAGSGPDYSLRDGDLYCNGSLAVGSWELKPIERE